MARPLSALRRSLDVMPSPVRERPGLLIRDPFHYSEDALIIPPQLVPFLRYFDGDHDEGDLAAALYRATGELAVQGLVRHLADTLGRAGFLEGEGFEKLREERRRAFAAAPLRPASHAGAAYPEDPVRLQELLRGYLDGSAEAPPAAGSDTIAVGAPHVSPDGGWRSYRAAYRAIPPGHADKTFVILGTSHYGEAGRFGLTRKAFVTPLGETRPDVAIVERLAAEAESAVEMEDYCHAVEHSIEFQVIFLQQLFGPAVSVVPILCGPFVHGGEGEGLPEDSEPVRRFLGALGELHARAGPRLFWVLGVDMAHMGRRYGDALAARAHEAEMARVEELDRKRIEAIARGDASGFWAELQEGGDALKWCGSSPLYAFLRAVAPSRGELLRYEQWNIDPESVVSFAALAFAGAGGAAPAGEGGA